MFADDLTAWTTGRNIKPLETRMTGLIKLIVKWNKAHNMKLSEKKGKCKCILFTNNRKDPDPRVTMNGEPLQTAKKTKLLSVMLDQQLTMKPHCTKILTEAKSRISQLCCAANSCFGPTQISLKNMYIAYI